MDEDMTSTSAPEEGMQKPASSRPVKNKRRRRNFERQDVEDSDQPQSPVVPRPRKRIRRSERQNVLGFVPKDVNVYSSYGSMSEDPFSPSTIIDDGYNMSNSPSLMSSMLPTDVRPIPSSAYSTIPLRARAGAPHNYRPIITPAVEHHTVQQTSPSQQFSVDQYYNIDPELRPLDAADQTLYNVLAHELASAENQPYEGLDYRTLPPQIMQDGVYIQKALEMTKANYLLRIGRDPPPTAEQESYVFQVRQILDSFEEQWLALGYALPVPDLVTSRAPWQLDFRNWVVSTGGDEALVNGLFEDGGASWEDAAMMAASQDMVDDQG